MGTAGAPVCSETTGDSDGEWLKGAGRRGAPVSRCIVATDGGVEPAGASDGLVPKGARQFKGIEGAWAGVGITGECDGTGTLGLCDSVGMGGTVDRANTPSTLSVNMGI